MISMELCPSGTTDSHFSILTNRSVKYITIKAGALDIEPLHDMPLDFENVLPSLPYREDTWKSAHITRNPSTNQLQATFSSAALPSVETIWHPRMIDHLDIERTGYLTLLAQECNWTAHPAPEPMVAKMARFDWEIGYIEAETRMYQALEGRGIAPQVPRAHPRGGQGHGYPPGEDPKRAER